MAARCPLLGDGITDDTLLHIVRFLPTARDLLCLLLANRRFRTKCIAAAPNGAEEAAQRQSAPEMLLLVQEAARLWVAGCSEQERDWVPRHGVESLLGLLHEVGALLLPLVFDRAPAFVRLSENRACGHQTDHPPRGTSRGEQDRDTVGVSFRGVYGGEDWR